MIPAGPVVDLARDDASEFCRWITRVAEKGLI
jgi:hypothetical protein